MNHIGFVAQEVAKALPEVVLNTNGHYAVDYSRITALVVEAIRERHGVIEK